MWKKNESEPAPQRPANPTPPSRPESRRELATIGASITVKGDLKGDEDLLIQGRVEGKIHFKQHNVTVGKSGRVKADIHGNSIRVEGQVDGDLYGQQDIVIRSSGRVQGNLVAPRVTLDNGSKFKGSIDMEPTPAASLQPEKKASAPISRHDKAATDSPVKPQQAKERFGRTAG
jgi:cytoskeletal protein CcmA (bactofilin family)